MKLFFREHQVFSAALLLLLGLGWIWVSAGREGITTHGLQIPRQGFAAPDFKLNTLAGETIQLSELQGQPVLVNFWASWCQPCRAEMPAIEHAFQKYKSQGIFVLAVNATNQDRITQVEGFVAELGLSFPILLDTQGEIMSLYKVSALPTSFFIDSNGSIREVIVGGPMAEALLTSRMEQLLEKPYNVTGH